MRFRRWSFGGFAAVASLALLVPLLVTPASSAGGAPRQARPPDARVVSTIDVTNSNNPACCPNLTYRYGEPEIAVNPKNPNNIVYGANQLAFNYQCQAEARAHPNEVLPCTLVNSVICAFFAPPGGPAPPCQPAGLINNEPGFDALGIFVTFNRGKTWTQVADPPGPPPGFETLNQPGDISVVAGPDGAFYLTYNVEAFSSATTGNPADVVTAGGVGFSRSTDGGRTWSTPTFTGTPIDRNFPVVDQSTGTLYVASGGPGALGPLSTGNPNAPPVGADRWLVASTNGGESFTSPEHFDYGSLSGPVSGPYLTAALGVFAATGRVCNPNAPFTGPTCAASTTSVTGSSPVQECGRGVSPPVTPPCVVFQYTTDQGKSWTVHALPGSSDSSGAPMVAADPTTAHHFTVAFADAAGTQFWVYQTRDSGLTWSSTKFPTTASGLGIWHPWMEYSPNGVLGLMWQDNPPTTDVPFTVWAAFSNDGGATFDSPIQLATSPPTQQAAFSFIDNLSDDFSFITFDRNYAYVGYADWSPGDRQGFMSTIKLSGGDNGHQ